MTNDLSHADIKRFWENMLRRHPEERRDGRATQEGTRWHELDDFDLKISLTVGSTGVRVFIRGEASANADLIRKRLAAKQAELEAELCVPMASPEHGRFFIDSLAIDLLVEANWNEAADWLFERGQTYEAALNEHLRKSR